MKSRDRMVLMSLVAAVLLVAGWILVVSPERKQAAAIGSQVAQARQSLGAAQAGMRTAEAAKMQYPLAYASLVNLGKAVPIDNQVASLLYQVDQASDGKHVSFDSITSGGGTGTPAPSAASPGAPGAASASGAFTTLPFTFNFSGSYFDLYHLLNRLAGFTQQSGGSDLNVTGRLLTIQSTTLAISSSGQLQGTITADAYVLPASSTPASATSPAAVPAAASAPRSPASTPAVIQANP